MTDRQTLLEACLLDPANPEPRMMLADALEENGELDTLALAMLRVEVGQWRIGDNQDATWLVTGLEFRRLLYRTAKITFVQPIGTVAYRDFSIILGSSQSRIRCAVCGKTEWLDHGTPGSALGTWWFCQLHKHFDRRGPGVDVCIAGQDIRAGQYVYATQDGRGIVTATRNEHGGAFIGVAIDDAADGQLVRVQTQAIVDMSRVTEAMRKAIMSRVGVPPRYFRGTFGIPDPSLITEISRQVEEIAGQSPRPPSD